MESSGALNELLGVHAEIASDEAAKLADRAVCDDGAGGDQLGRMQAARGREVRQTQELLMAIRKAENKGQAAGDGGKIKDRDNDAIEMPSPDRTAAVALSPSKRSRGAYGAARGAGRGEGLAEARGAEGTARPRTSASPWRSNRCRHE